jgi:hypothetical protein
LIWPTPSTRWRSSARCAARWPESAPPAPPAAPPPTELTLRPGEPRVRLERRSTFDFRLPTSEPRLPTLVAAAAAPPPPRRRPAPQRQAGAASLPRPGARGRLVPPPPRPLGDGLGDAAAGFRPRPAAGRAEDPGCGGRTPHQRRVVASRRARRSPLAPPPPRTAPRPARPTARSAAAAAAAAALPPWRCGRPAPQRQAGAASLPRPGARGRLVPPPPRPLGDGLGDAAAGFRPRPAAGRAEDPGCGGRTPHQRRVVAASHRPKPSRATAAPDGAASRPADRSKRPADRSKRPAGRSERPADRSEHPDEEARG